jgi:hypothetical protein
MIVGEELMKKCTQGKYCILLLFIVVFKEEEADGAWKSRLRLGTAKLFNERGGQNRLATSWIR